MNSYADCTFLHDARRPVDTGMICPYCGSTMSWVALRWFGRGTYSCKQCGEFPDFSPKRDQFAAADAPPAPSLYDHRSVLDLPPDPRPRVLMIDDSTAERDLYALMLEGAVRVLTAGRGSEGLALAARERPQAIVLDVMMPEMDGWEVCRRLKSNPETAGIPVIMLTAQDEPQLVDQAARSGATMLLTKPCPVDRLTSALHAAIAGAQP